MRQIKLIWDFKGSAALQIANHHHVHLKQFIAAEKLDDVKLTGVEIKNEFHAVAFMVVTDANMIAVRDALKPHRGELYL